MRHAKKRLQLNRFTSWHDATINSLARAIILNQSIKTTLHRAKASRQMIEKLITLAKTNTLFAHRQAQKVLGEHKLVNLLFNEIGPRFSKRSSGFTRIISLGKRRGDNAEMVIFELTEIKKKEAKKLKKQMEELKQYESSSEEEIIVKKKKPKNNFVYIEDDEEEEKKPVNIVINNSQPQQVTNASRTRPRVTLGNGFY